MIENVIRINRAEFDWDKSGLFPSRKTSTGKIYYTEEDVQKYYNGGTSNDHNSTNNFSEQ